MMGAAGNSARAARHAAWMARYGSAPCGYDIGSNRALREPATFETVVRAPRACAQPVGDDARPLAQLRTVARDAASQRLAEVVMPAR